MKKMLLFTLLVGGLCTTTPVVQAQERLPEYLQAEKIYSGETEHHVVLYCGRPSLVSERE